MISLTFATVFGIATISGSAFGFSLVPSKNNMLITSSSSSSIAQSRNWGDVEEIRPNVHQIFLKDDGVFPNSSIHPVLLLSNVFHGTQEEGSQLLVEGDWTAPWVWGVFTFHHYHSTAWEVLVCINGSADIQFGGPAGPIVDVKKGDVALVPPGVAHKQLNDKGRFALLGAYPQQTPNADTIRGVPSEAQRRAIAECFTPVTEPITGTRLDALYTTTSS